MVDTFQLTGAPKKRKRRKPAKCYCPDDAPLQVSFSGGRTSAYMLRRLLDSGTTLDYVLFCNTGKERDETLDFVHEVETRWSVPVVWLEYCRSGRMDVCDDSGHGMRIVSYETAHRNGQPDGPFDQLLEWANVLPNVATRSCSVQMKLRTMRQYLQLLHGLKHWQTFIGYRWDERDRIVDTNAHTPGYVHNLFPLVDDGITKDDVSAFWAQNDFDLKLTDDPRPKWGTYEGNCDLCYLKSRGKIRRLMRENPESAEWWIQAERAFRDKADAAGRRFRADRDGYATLFENLNAPAMFDDDEDDEPGCACFSGAFREDDEDLRV